MRHIVFGTVDIHGRCTPFHGDGTVVKTRLILTTIPFFGIKLPVLRKTISIGLFLESHDETVYEMPRIVLTTNGDKPLRIKLRRTQYRMAINAMGGEFFSLQTYRECRVYPRFGIFLGTINLEYGLFSRFRNLKIVAHWFGWNDYYEKSIGLHSL